MSETRLQGDDLRAVTALFDIGRAVGGDGRTVADYVGWLNRTLRLPVPFTVYVDATIDPKDVILKPGDELIRIGWSELIAAKWLPEVEAICRGRDRFEAKDDLTYRLPKYIITTMSKLELLERESLRIAATQLLWVDAGSARFTHYDLGELKLRPGIVERLGADVDLVIYASHHLRDYASGRPHEPFPGRCFQLMAGTVFMVRRSAAADLRKAVYDHVEKEWLAKGLWDTEQTAIGEVVLSGRIRTAIQEESGRQIRLLGAMFRRPKPSWMGLRWDTRNHYGSPPAHHELLRAARDGLRWAVRAVTRPSANRHVVAILPQDMRRRR